jgi:hypothetical protein
MQLAGIRLGIDAFFDRCRKVPAAIEMAASEILYRFDRQTELLLGVHSYKYGIPPTILAEIDVDV